MQKIQVFHISNEFVTEKSLIEDVLDIFLINSVCCIFNFLVIVKIAHLHMIK